MTKKGLLAQLAKNYYKVETAYEQPAEELNKLNIKKYLVGCLYLEGDVLRRENIWFAVENEGKSNETAYFIDHKPYKLKEEIVDELKDFREQVNSKYDMVERVSKDGAIVKKVEIDNGVAVENKYFVKPDLTEIPFLAEKETKEIIEPVK